MNVLFVLGATLRGNAPTELHAVPMIMKLVLRVGVCAAVPTATTAAFCLPGVA